jgi:hypothetical protein
MMKDEIKVVLGMARDSARGEDAREGTGVRS